MADNSRDIESQQRSINNQIQNERSQMSYYQSRNQELEGKRQRLSAAYERVKEIKSQYYWINRRENEELIDNSDEIWKGNKFNTYKNGTQYVKAIDYGIDEYYKDIDKILDAINMRRAEIENEIIGNESIIGRIVGTINSLMHQLQNLFN